MPLIRGLGQPYLKPNVQGFLYYPMLEMVF